MECIETIAKECGYKNERKIYIKSRIKVENMRSDVLLMAPSYDDCWPSEQAVPRMERILREYNYPYRVKVRMYENASHAIAMDMGALKKNAVLRFLLGILLPAEKKHSEACERARKDSMQLILDFLEEWKGVDEQSAY